MYDKTNARFTRHCPQLHLAFQVCPQGSYVPSGSSADDLRSTLCFEFPYKYNSGSDRNKSNSSGGKMKYNTFKKIMTNIRNMVKNGEITKREGEMLSLEKTLEMLQCLKMPEDQSWEIEEYAGMAKEYN